MREGKTRHWKTRHHTARVETQDWETRDRFAQGGNIELIKNGWKTRDWKTRNDEVWKAIRNLTT